MRLCRHQKMDQSLRQICPRHLLQLPMKLIVMAEAEFEGVVEDILHNLDRDKDRGILHIGRSAAHE